MDVVPLEPLYFNIPFFGSWVVQILLAIIFLIAVVRGVLALVKQLPFF